MVFLSDKLFININTYSKTTLGKYDISHMWQKKKKKVLIKYLKFISMAFWVGVDPKFIKWIALGVLG